jgi:hypothetical protein
MIATSSTSLCRVYRGNLIKHIFSSRSREEGISFFIMPPSCFVSVSQLNFWQVFTSDKAMDHGITKIGPSLGRS